MPEPIDRRKFISAAAALALLGGAAITIGCGASDPGTGPTQPPPPPSTPNKFGDVSENHGHSAVIQGAVLDTGGGITLNIQGGASHQHLVTLSGTEIVSIKAGTRVTKDSSSDEGLFGLHLHMVTFN